MQSLIQGSMWMQYAKGSYENAKISDVFDAIKNRVQLSSNLFYVEAPGRFQYYLCKLQMKASYVGKTRYVSEEAVDDFAASFNAGSSGEMISKEVVKNTPFPDAYKLEMVFTSMAPSNLNMHLHYFVRNKKAPTNIIGANFADAGVNGIKTKFNTEIEQASKALGG